MSEPPIRRWNEWGVVLLKYGRAAAEYDSSLGHLAQAAAAL